MFIPNNSVNMRMQREMTLVVYFYLDIIFYACLPFFQMMNNMGGMGMDGGEEGVSRTLLF